MWVFSGRERRGKKSAVLSSIIYYLFNTFIGQAKRPSPFYLYHEFLYLVVTATSRANTKFNFIPSNSSTFSGLGQFVISVDIKLSLQIDIYDPESGRSWDPLDKKPGFEILNEIQLFFSPLRRALCWSASTFIRSPPRRLPLSMLFRNSGFHTSIMFITVFVLGASLCTNAYPITDAYSVTYYPPQSPPTPMLQSRNLYGQKWILDTYDKTLQDEDKTVFSE